MFNIKNIFNNINDSNPLVIHGEQLHKGSVLPNQTAENSTVAMFKGIVTPLKTAEYKF